MNFQSRTQDNGQIEARLAARLSSGLNIQSESVPHDIAERLRVAREQAVVRAQAVRSPNAAQVNVRPAGGVAEALLGFTPWLHRLASAFPLVMLVSGLVAIEHWAAREQVVAAADFDAQLLADDLPPAAYSDPGFGEFIRSSPTP